MSETLIHVADVTKSVTTGTDTLTILNGINFEVKQGETVALIGASGSGKSTLLSLLAGLDLPTAGSISVAGQVLEKLDEEQRASLRRDTIGFVFQSFMLMPALTALENVMLPAEIKGLSDIQATAEKLLREVGLEHRLHHFPSQLSGGEQQRVAIARAFMLSPPLLLCDEPTGNLDIATGEKVTKLLFELNTQHQTTLVIVTHDNKLANLCQRQIKLHAGEIVPDAATSTLSEA